MDAETKHILVVDDEPKYVRGIQAILQAAGHTVLTAGDGQTAVDLAANRELDLILLDVRMAGMDGYETCRQIREFSLVPVIMLTALAETADIVQGLNAGADDYVTKPFKVDELFARMQAVFRRTESRDRSEASACLLAGDLRVDLAERRVFVGPTEVHLTSTEYRLLTELAHHPGQVLSSEHLLQTVWGATYRGDDRLVWRTIHRLRQKIEADPESPQRLATRAGSGYVLLP